MASRAIFLLILTAIIAVGYCMRQQAVAVKGKLLCGSAPAKNVRVKLWEEDTGSFSIVI